MGVRAGDACVLPAPLLLRVGVEELDAYSTSISGSIALADFLTGSLVGVLVSDPLVRVLE